MKMAFYNLAGWLTVCLLSIASLPVFADTKAVISHCRDLSLDQAGFIECIKLLEVESELSLATIESEWLTYLQDEQDTSAESDDQSANSQLDQLLATSVAYREYRNQHCDFVAFGLDEDSMPVAGGACRVSMDRERANQLRATLIEQRASAASGKFYRGYYLQVNGAGLFQSCDQRQDWSVSASDDLQQRLAARYDELTVEALEMVYVELRGKVSAAENASVSSDIQINELNLIRPVLETDCQSSAAVVSATTASAPTEFPADDAFTDDVQDTAAADDATDITIDELGGAGFVYGYFGLWTSMCAAESQLICKAQSDDTFSTEGDWQLIVDRSADNNWRVRVAPLTDSHVVSSQVQVNVDSAALFSVPAADDQILLGNALTLASGNRALQLLNTMRDGASIELSWNTAEQSSATVMFSLSGVRLALQYFDERGN